MAAQGSSPLPTTTTAPSGAQTAGAGFNPAPLTPTPKGMAQYNAVQKSIAKKKLTAAKKGGKIGAKGPTPVANDPSGSGGPNDPAWQHLADLYKNGLPG